MAGNSRGEAPQVRQEDLAPRVDELRAAGPLGIQRIATSYTVAMRVPQPRDPNRVLDAARKEAAMLADRGFYSWTVKSKNRRTGEVTRVLVEGVSIDMTMMLARNWGNCAVEFPRIEEDHDSWSFWASFIDLETGFTVTRVFRQSKRGVSGDYDRDRAIDMIYQVGQSKAARNAVAHGLPAWLLDACLEAAKSAVESGVKQDRGGAKVSKLVEAYGSIGVDREALERRIGMPLEAMTPAAYRELRGLWTALRDATTSVEVEFPAAPPTTADVPQEPHVEPEAEVVEPPRDEASNGRQPARKRRPRPRDAEQPVAQAATPEQQEREPGADEDEPPPQVSLEDFMGGER